MSKKNRNKKQKEEEQESSSSETTLGSDKLIIAPLSVRAKVFILDTFMIYTPILYIIVYIFLGDKETFQGDQFYPFVGTILYGLILAFLQSVKKMSIGGRAYDVMVVDSTTGKSITFVVAFLRYLLSLISIMTLFGIIIAMTNKKRQTLHDFLCKTVVLQTIKELPN